MVLYSVPFTKSSVYEVCEKNKLVTKPILKLITMLILKGKSPDYADWSCLCYSVDAHPLTNYSMQWDHSNGCLCMLVHVSVGLLCASSLC